MYSNSLMATVNSRKSYMESTTTSREVSSYALSDFSAASNPAMRGGLFAGATGGTIVYTQREVINFENPCLNRSWWSVSIYWRDKMLVLWYTRDLHWAPTTIRSDWREERGRKIRCTKRLFIAHMYSCVKSLHLWLCTREVWVQIRLGPVTIVASKSAHYA